MIPTKQVPGVVVGTFVPETDVVPPVQAGAQDERKMHPYAVAGAQTGGDLSGAVPVVVAVLADKELGKGKDVKASEKDGDKVVADKDAVDKDAMDKKETAEGTPGGEEKAAEQEVNA